MYMPIPVVDVFAGPGGLNEGFSSVSSPDGPVFKTVASVEMNAMACKTLTLRAAAREAFAVDRRLPDEYYDYTEGRISWSQLELTPSFGPRLKQAATEVHQHTLAPDTRDESDQLIAKALGEYLANDGPWVLVGGPPCQAYSLAGRSRRTHDEKFFEDHKHTLYREYLNIIRKHSPHVFVMENVKGMLSSKLDGGRVFRAIRHDLSNPGGGHRYQLRSFTVRAETDELGPADFIIRSERFGVPQARHRVILLGVRDDLGLPAHDLLHERAPVGVETVIGDLPRIRSEVSPRGQDSWGRWLQARVLGTNLAKVNVEASPSKLHRVPKSSYQPKIVGDLGAWLLDPGRQHITLHEGRRHMFTDLARYAYMAAMAEQGLTPRVNELPAELRPKHRNVGREDTPFTDRFRVQRAERPSSTIASHIAKDGHYYIHYDSSQMRSLTVREAARLQTFPDNYFFVGSRTDQYHQVGNAVPPYLAHQLGTVVAKLLGATT